MEAKQRAAHRRWLKGDHQHGGAPESLATLARTFRHHNQRPITTCAGRQEGFWMALGWEAHPAIARR